MSLISYGTESAQPSRGQIATPWSSLGTVIVDLEDGEDSRLVCALCFESLLQIQFSQTRLLDMVHARHLSQSARSCLKHLDAGMRTREASPEGRDLRGPRRDVLILFRRIPKIVRGRFCCRTSWFNLLLLLSLFESPLYISQLQADSDPSPRSQPSRFLRDRLRHHGHEQIVSFGFVFLQVGIANGRPCCHCRHLFRPQHYQREPPVPRGLLSFCRPLNLSRPASTRSHPKV